MPRTAYGAAARAAEAERKKAEAEERHRDRVARIIRSEAAMQGLKTDKAIAEAAGIRIETFRKTINGDVSWTLEKLLMVCNGLEFGNDIRAAILGGRA